MFEHLEKIDNGSLKRAHQMSYDGSIWSSVDDGHIYAERDGDFFINMSLTKSGKNLLRFSKLTIKDIDNSYGKNSMKEWLGKPLILASCKYILLGILALLGGVYSSNIKDFMSSLSAKTNGGVEMQSTYISKPSTQKHNKSSNSDGDKAAAGS